MKMRWKKRVALAGMILAGALAGPATFARADEPADIEAETEAEADSGEETEAAEAEILDVEEPEEALEGDTSWQNSYKYTTDSNKKTITLKYYVGESGKKEIVVPASAVIQGVTYQTVLKAYPYFALQVDRNIFLDTLFSNSNIVQAPTKITIEPGVILPEDCTALFGNCKILKQVDMSGVNMENVTGMSCMFYNCPVLEKVTFGSGSKTTKVTDTSRMFKGCYLFSTLDAENFKTDSLTNLHEMFDGCHSMAAINAANWSMAKAEDLSGMFQDCWKLTALDAGKWNLAKAASTENMFNGCRVIETVKIGQNGTPNITNVKGMFSGCGKLATLDLSNFDLRKVTSAANLDMLSGCSALTSVISPKYISESGDAALPAEFVNEAITITVNGQKQAVNYSFHALPAGSIALKRGSSPRTWPFSDFSPKVTSWKYTGIVFCNENGIMMGDQAKGDDTPLRTFRPDDAISRRDFALILYRLQGSPSVAGLSHPFKDVPAGAYYTDAVIWAYNTGIVKGTSETTFSPINDITRVQIAIMLNRYEDKFGKGNSGVAASLDHFTDSSGLKTEYAEALSWAVGMGVIGGIEDTSTGTLRLGAKEKATRAQCAKMIMSYLEY